MAALSRNSSVISRCADTVCLTNATAASVTILPSLILRSSSSKANPLPATHLSEGAGMLDHGQNPQTANGTKYASEFQR